MMLSCAKIASRRRKQERIVMHKDTVGAADEVG